MLIRQNTAFPHPLLSPHTEDYQDSEFDIRLDEIEENISTGEVKISGNAVLNDNNIKSLVSSGKASLFIACECFGTYFIKCFKVPLDKFTIEFEKGQLYGRVDIQGIISSTLDHVELSSRSINDEFPEHTRRLPVGAPIAATSIYSFEAGPEKLQSMESIFSLSSSESVEPGNFLVDTDSERIQIIAHPDLYKTISILRRRKERDVLISSLFLPALMSALDVMRGDASCKDRRWYRVISAKCTGAGIDLSKNDLATAAQKLLHGPLGLLHRVFGD